jgi:hypothetical protein
LTRLIEATGESANIDAKGPMEWDGGEASAGLMKDILALANSRDGGVIVVGKDEGRAGRGEEGLMAVRNGRQPGGYEHRSDSCWPLNTTCARNCTSWHHTGVNRSP